jgi:hypothetical protein
MLLCARSGTCVPPDQIRSQVKSRFPFADGGYSSREGLGPIRSGRFSPIASQCAPGCQGSLRLQRDRAVPSGYAFSESDPGSFWSIFAGG